MKNSFWAKAKIAMLFGGLIFVFAQIFSVELQAQKRRKTPAARAAAKKKLTPKKRRAAAARTRLKLPKVTQIDALALGNLLKRAGENPKPLLINFWATWCDPCREEFPDLVKIDADYKGKIDFITISLDYLSEINGDVPKFLARMKAEMPAYLLKTADENEAIALVSKEWQGGLPFTILFDQSGKEIYMRQGKIKLETVRAELDKILSPPAPSQQTQPSQQPQPSAFEKGKLDAEKDLAAGKLILKVDYVLPRRVKLAEEYGIKYESIPIHKAGNIEYIDGYNSISEAEILKKFGAQVLKKVRQPRMNYPADVVELSLTPPARKVN